MNYSKFSREVARFDLAVITDSSGLKGEEAWQCMEACAESVLPMYLRRVLGSDGPRYVETMKKMDA